jgi:hypothetical protein
MKLKCVCNSCSSFLFERTCSSNKNAVCGARLAENPKFVWVFNANCDGTIIYNDPVFILRYSDNSVGLRPIITKKMEHKGPRFGDIFQ